MERARLNVVNCFCINIAIWSIFVSSANMEQIRVGKSNFIHILYPVLLNVLNT